MNSVKERKTPIGPIRLVLQLLSLILCIALAVGVMATVLISDLRALTSSGGIRTILESLTTATAGTEDPALLAPLPATNGLTQLNSTAGEEESEEEDSEETELPQFSAAMLTNPDALAAYLHSIAQDTLGEETDITVEQVQTFITESTVMDFVSDKISDYIGDVLTGQQTASITSQDIMDLFEENEALLEETFQIQVTEEDKAALFAQVDQAMAEADLDNTIRTGVDGVMNESIPGLKNMSVGDLLQIAGKLSQVKVLLLFIGICIVLAGLLLLVNRYLPPRGLRWIGRSCIFAGLPMAAPLFVVHFLPGMVTQFLPEAAEFSHVLDGFYSVMAPYHFTPLAVGLILAVVSTVWGRIYTRQIADT